MEWMHDWLDWRARSTPGRTALIAGGRSTPDRTTLIAGDQSWTFAELDAWVSETARRLYALGVREGDRVGLLMRSSADFVALVHGISRLGAVLVPLNTRLTPAELAWQAADARLSLLVYDEEFTAAAEKVAAEARLATVATPEVAAVAAPPAPVAEALSAPVAEALPSASGSADTPFLLQKRPADLHSIVYTSGTTGRPKGAMLTYENHLWSAVASALNLGVGPNDAWLAVLPLFHVGGLSILVRSLIYGIPAVVHPSFDPAAVNRAIDEGVSHISVVSVMLARMLDERGDRPYPDTLRTVLAGGGPVPAPLLKECAARGIPVVQTYGMTETASQVVTLAPEDALRKLGSAGKPLLGTELRIAMDGAREALPGEAPPGEAPPGQAPPGQAPHSQAPPGEVGEILLRGPTVTAGYWQRPDATAEALRGGWLHTGDLGYLDEEGYLYMVERRTDLIISGGENVYPAEIEAVLLAHPAVEEAGVTGLPDTRWGQVPVAAVKLRAEFQVAKAELLAFCAERLARYKVPRKIVWVEELPRSGSRKLQRHRLPDVIRAAEDGR